MSEDPKVVIIAEKINMSSRGELDNKRRTAVFSETTTLKEILDWARMRNDVVASMFGEWKNAQISISEDEISNPQKEGSLFFEDKTEVA